MTFTFVKRKVHIDAVAEQLTHVDGVMIGRAAYHDPWLLADADERIFGLASSGLSRQEVAEAMAGYMEDQAASGVPVNRITRHMLGLFHGVPGARAWRRALSGGGEHTVETYRAALAALWVGLQPDKDLSA